MLTVNHTSNGIETIYQTTVATYIGPNAVYGSGGLSIDHPDPSRISAKLLQDGDAFVMNSAGATVAKYHLPDSPKFLGGIGLAECPSEKVDLSPRSVNK